MTMSENVGVLIWEKVWLEKQGVSVLGPAPTLSPSCRLVPAIFEPNLFPYKYSNILKHSHSDTLTEVFSDFPQS